MNNVSTIRLEGCRVEPIASYMKALGVIRMLAEQADPDLQASWKTDRLEIRSSLDEKAIIDFFLNQYCPTPILSPWNGGSGFYPKDNKSAILKIESSKERRFFAYSKAITEIRKILDSFGLTGKPDASKKSLLLSQLRNNVSDNLLKWLDAAYTILSDGPGYPPLMGTGGNDGRLEFSNNFMQRLLEVIHVEDGTPTFDSEKWLRVSLLDEPGEGLLRSKPIGQFFPGAAGGPNMGEGFNDDSLINPWDYILLIEGSLVFSAGVARKLEKSDQGFMIYPFTVRQTPAGYASSASADEGLSRAEIWLPIWNRPTGYKEIRYLFSEGRARLGRRNARDGMDFARAIATLGVDRGFNSFQRFGFQVRNGRSYFALPLSRWKVKSRPGVRILDEIERWMGLFHRAARDEKAPERIRRADRNMSIAAMEFCRDDNQVNATRLLFAVADAESALTASLKYTKSRGIPPIPGLSDQWYKIIETDRPEFRIASAVASVHDREIGSMRMYFEPVVDNGYFVKWTEEDSPVKVVGHFPDPTRNFVEILKRRLTEAVKANRIPIPLWGFATATLVDIYHFINGETDDSLLMKYLRSMILFNWRSVRFRERKSHYPPLPVIYAALKLCLQPVSEDVKVIDLKPVYRTLTGDLEGAAFQAMHRLKVFGSSVKHVEGFGDAMYSKRLAAALLIPISGYDRGRLGEQVIIKKDNEDTIQ